MVPQIRTFDFIKVLSVSVAGPVNPDCITDISSGQIAAVYERNVGKDLPTVHSVKPTGFCTHEGALQDFGFVRLTSNSTQRGDPQSDCCEGQEEREQCDGVGRCPFPKEFCIALYCGRSWRRPDNKLSPFPDRAHMMSPTREPLPKIGQNKRSQRQFRHLSLSQLFSTFASSAPQLIIGKEDFTASVLRTRGHPSTEQGFLKSIATEMYVKWLARNPRNAFFV